MKSVGVMGGVEMNMATKVLIKSKVWATPQTHKAEMLQCQDKLCGPGHSWIPQQVTDISQHSQMLEMFILKEIQDK